jgi:hypothetical protein
MPYKGHPNGHGIKDSKNNTYLTSSYHTLTYTNGLPSIMQSMIGIATIYLRTEDINYLYVQKPDCFLKIE